MGPWTRKGGYCYCWILVMFNDRMKSYPKARDGASSTASNPYRWRTRAVPTNPHRRTILGFQWKIWHSFWIELMWGTLFCKWCKLFAMNFVTVSIFCYILKSLTFCLPNLLLAGKCLWEMSPFFCSTYLPGPNWLLLDKNSISFSGYVHFQQILQNILYVLNWIWFVKKMSNMLKLRK